MSPQEEGDRDEETMAEARLVVHSGIASGRVVCARGNFAAQFFRFADRLPEIPPVFTSASGGCSVKIRSDGTSASYELTYTGLSSAVTQAHINFGPQPNQWRNHRLPL